MPYDTTAGLPTRGLTYSKLLDHLREAQDCTAMLMHLQRTESGVKDDALANGWFMITENLRMMERFVTKLAQGSLQ